MSKMRLLSLSATILWLLLGINAGCGGADDTSTSPAEGIGGTQATGGSGGTDNVGGDDGIGGEDGVIYAVLGDDGRYHCEPPMEVDSQKDRPPRCQVSASTETPDASPPDATDEPDASPPTPDAAPIECMDLEGHECTGFDPPCHLSLRTGFMLSGAPVPPCFWDCIDEDQTAGHGIWPDGMPEQSALNQCDAPPPTEE